MRPVSVSSLAIALLSTSCSWFGPRESISIGVVDVFSGPRAVFGVSTRNGIQLAVDEANRKGGVQGKTLRIVAQDDEGVPEKAAEAVEHLAAQNKIVAVLGTSASSRTLVMAPAAQALKIPMVTSASTHPKVTQTGDYIFRVCFIDTFQGPVMAQFMRKDLGVRRIAILRDLDTPYSMTLAEFFKRTFIRLGGDVVSDQTYHAGATSFEKQLAVIAKLKPEAIYAPAYYSDIAHLAEQARSMGIQATFSGGDGWDSNELQGLAKGALTGSYFSSHFSPKSQDPTYLAFKKSFARKYRREPDAYSALGYDAAKVLIAAMQAAAPLTSETLRDQLSKTRDFPGVTGNITLDAQRNAIKPVVILKVEDQGNALVKAYTPNS